ncbi:hypothetical protein [Solibacillus sp. CAU 1738]|uniref:hypothetical protein n=1 Tax=Solibacillus sp. CAU 1738 TaxID=3140363 RepID=UPI00326189D4
MNNILKRFGLLLLLSVIFLAGCQEDDKSNTDSDIMSFDSDSFTVENEKFYLYGITLDDSKAKVIEHLGSNYEDVMNLELSTSEATDSAIQYNNGSVIILFNKDEVVRGIYIDNIQQSDFDKIYNSYDGFKYEEFTKQEDKYDPNNIGFIYSEKADHLLTAKYDNKRILMVRLKSPDPNFNELLEYINNQQKQ